MAPYIELRRPSSRKGRPSSATWYIPLKLIEYIMAQEREMMRQQGSMMKQLDLMGLVTSEVNDSFMQEALRNSVGDLLALSVSLDDYSVSINPDQTAIDNYSFPLMDSGSDTAGDASVISLPRHSTPRFVLRSESVCYKEEHPASDDDEDYPLTLWRPETPFQCCDDAISPSNSRVILNFTPVMETNFIDISIAAPRKQSIRRKLKNLRRRVKGLFRR